VETTALISLIRKYGMDFKDTLVYDRIREELRIFCANHTIDEVYNTMFLVRPCIGLRWGEGNRAFFVRSLPHFFAFSRLWTLDRRWNVTGL